MIADDEFAPIGLGDLGLSPTRLARREAEVSILDRLQRRLRAGDITMGQARQMFARESEGL